MVSQGKKRKLELLQSESFPPSSDPRDGLNVLDPFGEEFWDAFEYINTEPQPSSITTFQMIPTNQQNGLRLCSQTGKTLWTYRLYRGPDGKGPIVKYCDTFEKGEAAAKLISDSAVLGLDLEWKPRGGFILQEHVSVLQLASDSHIVILHIARIPGSTPAELLSPTMNSILENPLIVKVANCIKGDGTRLKVHFNITPQAFVDVSKLASNIDPLKKKGTSLAALVEDKFGLPLDKSYSTTTSGWHLDKKLSPVQIEYAAADAYAGLKLYQALMMARTNFTPPFESWKSQAPKPKDLFQKLKDRRAQLGTQHGKDVTTFAFNHQLEAIVKALPINCEDLRKITGMSQARVEMYGEALLDVVRVHIGILASQSSPSSATNLDTSSQPTVSTSFPFSSQTIIASCSSSSQSTMTSSPTSAICSQSTVTSSQPPSF